MAYRLNEYSDGCIRRSEHRVSGAGVRERGDSAPIANSRAAFLFCGRETARDGQGGALAEWLEGCCEPVPEDDRICGAGWRTFHAGHPSMTGGGKPLTRGQRLGSRLPSLSHPRCMHAAMTNPCHIRPLVIYELRLRVSSEEAQER